MSEPIEGEIVSPEPGKKKKPTTLAKRENGALAATSPAPGSIEDLMVRAVEQGNMDVIERVFALSEKANAERARKAFFGALSEFQRECPVISKKKAVLNKDRTTRYHYAPLGDIVKQVAPLLAKHGLSYDFSDAEVIPFTEETGGPFLKLITNVHHKDGHSRAFPFLALIESNEFMNPTQQAGSSNMYAKRYGFCNAFGILTAEDDIDGGSPRGTAAERRAPVTQPKAKPTAQKKAAEGKPVERTHLTPAAEGEEVEASTIKLLTSKMEHAALGNGEFKKRFGLDGLEQVKRADLQTVLGWIIDPQNA